MKVAHKSPGQQWYGLKEYCLENDANWLESGLKSGLDCCCTVRRLKVGSSRLSELMMSAARGQLRDSGLLSWLKSAPRLAVGSGQLGFCATSGSGRIGFYCDPNKSILPSISCGRRRWRRMATLAWWGRNRRRSGWLRWRRLRRRDRRWSGLWRRDRWWSWSAMTTIAARRLHRRSIDDDRSAKEMWMRSRRWRRLIGDVEISKMMVGRRVAVVVAVEGDRLQWELGVGGKEGIAVAAGLELGLMKSMVRFLGLGVRERGREDEHDPFDNFGGFFILFLIFKSS